MVIIMLTPRLACIQNHVTASVIADIGTDHAYLPISLVEEGRLKKGIACDIRSGPLAIARENIKKHHLSDKIETRLGDGLSPLRSEDGVREIVIAGMGALTIMDILSAGEQTARKADRLILQPMDGQAELRYFLLQNHYIVFHEDLAVEREKVYQIFDIRSGEQELFEKEIDYIIPPALYTHPHIHALVEKQRKKWERIYRGKLESKTEKDSAGKIKRLLRELEDLNL